MHPGHCVLIDCGTFPTGILVYALLLALTAALKQGRSRSRARDIKEAWMLWLLGPATVLCVVAMVFAMR